MKIGILTYYRVANFGANLQAVSTYKYLERHGHTPIMIHYMSEELYNKTDKIRKDNSQIEAHLDFIDSIICNQTKICFTSEDVNEAIERDGIEAIIVGSDAVVQHHPLLERIKLVGGRLRKRIKIEQMGTERLFPNLFWGIGINNEIKGAMMSVASQNSQFSFFTPWLKADMRKALERFKYISVRDKWTQNMMQSITLHNIPITPDPVFAFKYNVGELIPSQEETIKKFNLPDKYVLISFLNYFLPTNCIFELKKLFAQDGIDCVAFPSPIGLNYRHNYDYEIKLPLSPIDWYAIIAYSSGYIGNNMHPIIVALHNTVPCFCIDNYLSYNLFNKPKDDNSSKILDLLRMFELEQNRMTPKEGEMAGASNIIHSNILSFDYNKVKMIAESKYKEYEFMMQSILETIE